MFGFGLLLFLLGWFLYWLIQRTVAQITTTPVWVLWLVLMAPVLIWLSWIATMGQQPIPQALVIAPFFLCPLVYWLLVEAGRPTGRKEVPSPEVLAAPPKPVRPITEAEEQDLRHCFPWGVYYLQTVDYYPQAILCRGRLRTSPDRAYGTIRDNIAQRFGDRFVVMFQESFQGQPFFALVPNPHQAGSPPAQEPLFRPWLALALLAITLFTTTIMGVELAGVEARAVEQDPRVLLQGLFYSVPLVAILGLRELSQYFLSGYYRIQTTLPYFIPIPFFLGTFGAFRQKRSPMPHRQALFDLVILGAGVTLVLSLLAFLGGLMASQVVPLPKNHSILTFEALDLRFSLMLSLLAKGMLGHTLGPTMGIHLHPLGIAGYLGLLFTAITLLPVGQFDGGRIIHAIFGQKIAVIVGQVTRILMIFLTFIQPDFLLLTVMVWLFPITSSPTLNDVSELDNRRDLLGLGLLIAVVVMLFPLPPSLAAWLHL